MFLGEYTHTVDDKGRLTIPAKYRSYLEDGLVVTRGLDQNLMAYPVAGWMELAEQVARQPISNQDVREFRRRIFAGAADLVPDKQGRILLPAYLREFAGIDGEVVIAGMYNHIEIWSMEAWLNVRQAAESSRDAARWDRLGI